MKYSAAYRPSVYLAVALVVWLSASRALATDSNWTNTAGGVFNVPGNWSAGVPLPADDATFNLNNTYTVTFSNSPTNTRLLVQNGAVTFNLAGQTYTLTGATVFGGVAGQTGRFTLTNGEIDGNTLLLGDVPGATGFMTVTTNGKWLGGQSFIGDSAVGTLSIQNGGFVDVSSANLGGGATGIGTATVSGSGSTWDTGTLLFVGGAGTGSLTVTTGGSVVSSNSTIANTASAEGEVTVTGTGSRWTNGGSFIVGNAGHGELSVLSGAEVQSGNGSIGGQVGGLGEVTVSGTNSLWKTAELRVGDAGDGTLMIASGGHVESTFSQIATIPGGSGNATVTGASSSWTATSLNVGFVGPAKLSVLDGGTVTVGGNTLLGVSTFGSFGGDGTLLVDGPTSAFSSFGNMIIGIAGRGIATVSNGATLSLTSPTGRIEIANNTPSALVSSLVVTGAGSTVNAPGGVFVSGSNSAAGGTGQLTVSNGGVLDAGGGTVKIWPVLMAAIQLHGGTIHARNFERLGSFDFRDGLLHVDGGTFTNGAASSTLTINGFDADDQPTLRLSNAATTANVGNMTVGNTNAGALEVLSGSTIQSGVSTVANTGTSSGTVVVDGPGSTWSMGGLQLGSSGQALMHIRNGGKVNSNSSALGGAASASGTVTVDGGSWNVSNTLDVGFNGRGSLDVRAGGIVSAGFGNVGTGASGIGILTVDGAGSRLDTGSSFSLGQAGSGDLTVSNGGVVTNNSLLFVGASGNARLSVLGGGRLTSTFTALATSASGSATATLSGSNSIWTNASSLIVGGNIAAAGGSALLTIENGSTLNVGNTPAETLKIWNPGTLTLDGGTINARQFERLGTFNFHDGTLNVTGGQYISAGPLTLNGADADDLPTLRLSGGATTSGITTLVVGGTHRGVLEITGGSQLTSGASAIGVLPGSSGSVTLASGALWNLSGSLSVGGSFSLAGGAGTLTIAHGAMVNVPTSVVRLHTDGVINLNGGTLTMNGFDPLGGQFNFNSGTVTFIGAASPADAVLTTLLGATRSLSAGRNLTGGSVFLTSPLSIDGGSLSPSLLTVGSVLQIHSGSATSVVSTTIQPAGLLRLTNTGLIDAGSELGNNGLIELAAETATLKAGLFTNNGILSGRGRVNAPLSNSATGSIRAENGARLMFLGAPNNNAGRIETLSGGTIEFQQSLSNLANGLVTGRDGVLRFTGGLTNAGSLGFTSGIMDVFGDITNNGPGGKIVVSGRGTATFYDDVVNNGSVQVSTGSTAVYFGAVSGTGTFPGGGTNFFEGDLRPGASPAIINFAGDVEFGSASSLEVEIGGTTPGTGHDQINVGGTATLNGTLDIDLINGFVPSIGQQFQVMTFGSRAGTFANVTGGDISALLQLQPVYSATDLKLVAISPTEKTWGVDANGQASVGSNWFGGVPPTAPNDSAAFTTVISANRTVNLDVPLSLNRMRFDDDNNYTIAGPQAITLSGSGLDPATIHVQNLHGNGAHTISARLVLAHNATILQESSQPLTISGPVDNSSGRTVKKSGAGAVSFTGTQQWGDNARLEINAGKAQFNLGAATNVVIGTNVAAQVADGATLELAGVKSALSDGTDHVAIANDGLVRVAGTSQIVGNITGAGEIIVAPAADLTAGDIHQSRLTFLELGPLAGGKLTLRPGSGTAVLNELLFLAGAGVGEGGAAESAVAVPEPSAWMLACLAVVTVLALVGRVRRVHRLH